MTALLALAVTDPSKQTHFTLCPLKLMGFTWCPGCGLGHSISFFLHGEFKNAFQAHWLGIPAVMIISYRIRVLVKSFTALPVWQQPVEVQNYNV